MRDETEWVELVEHGFNKLAGADTTKIVKLANEALSNTVLDFSTRLYGNGDAGRLIVENLK